jgi:hypothetical protein
MLEELTRQYNPKDFEPKDTIPDKGEPLKLPHYVSREFFLPCPFCGESVNVFQITETRYGGANPYSWTIECMNMGCIFERPSTGDLSLKHLMDCWNKRY